MLLSVLAPSNAAMPPRRWCCSPTAAAAITPLSAVALLAAARLLSAFLNIIHDCDETYNYLEPLHYILFGSGMQTWEYSSQFALRSYLYLLLHAPPAVAPALLLGAGRTGEHGSCDGFLHATRSDAWCPIVP